MNHTPPGQAMVQDAWMRWFRALTWALGQSAGLPRRIDQMERIRIEYLRDRILAVGEDQAWEEHREALPFELEMLRELEAGEEDR